MNRSRERLVRRRTEAFDQRVVDRNPKEYRLTLISRITWVMQIRCDRFVARNRPTMSIVEITVTCCAHDECAIVVAIELNSDIRCVHQIVWTNAENQVLAGRHVILMIVSVEAANRKCKGKKKKNLNPHLIIRYWCDRSPLQSDGNIRRGSGRNIFKNCFSNRATSIDSSRMRKYCSFLRFPYEFVPYSRSSTKRSLFVMKTMYRSGSCSIALRSMRRELENSFSVII